ncbi:MAG TPA: dihydrolipoyllysine-residue acetyltransferase [Pseudomonadales bacterium]|nr:dihydrolipoyllysine-residue acetyltransferase [Pseudomonadales bacterium]
MSIQTVVVPDIGADQVEVIEICVAIGDTVAAEDSLIVLESDKASMEVPSPVSGKIVGITVNVGDQVAQGTAIMEVEVEGAAASAEPVAEAPVAAPVADEILVPAAAPAATATALQTVHVPDLGGASDVECIEVCVAVGDVIDAEQSLIVLETDKASMEIPAPVGGKVVSLSIKTGDTVNVGDVILELEVAGAADAAPASSPVTEAPASAAPATPAAAPVATAPAGIQTVTVPDLGGASNVECIEVCVAVGDEVSEEQSLIVLETDKASMEIPAPFAGKVVSVAVKTGSTVNVGDVILELDVAGATAVAQVAEPVTAAPAPATAPAPAAAAQGTAFEPKTQTQPRAEIVAKQGDVYAGPAVRMLARELGVDLHQVSGTGPRGRISKDDLHGYIKARLAAPAPEANVGSGIPPVPAVDFSKFGPVREEKMSKLHRLTAENMSRNWLNVPHVTQFDDADITELEDFRASVKAEAEKHGVKLTPLPFLLKACAAALRANPKFNASLGADGETIVYKDYVHIGVAVDTPAGLVVPVIRDVDQKSIYQLAAETAELGQKAKDRKLTAAEMQGGCFTISSLGGIGGTGFTPIVNSPEVAILGVSKLDIKPVWNGKEFVPRKMLPLSLSYDHRAINGSDAGRFFTQLGAYLADIRRLVL